MDSAIGNEGAKVIAEALKENASLTQIDLRYNNSHFYSMVYIVNFSWSLILEMKEQKQLVKDSKQIQQSMKLTLNVITIAIFSIIYYCIDFSQIVTLKIKIYLTK